MITGASMLSVSKKNTWSPPAVRSIMDDLVGCRYFSKTDNVGGFNFINYRSFRSIKRKPLSEFVRRGGMKPTILMSVRWVCKVVRDPINHSWRVLSKD